MRVVNLLNNADASITQLGVYETDCGQDMRWSISVTSSGINGIPKIYIEESLDNTYWSARKNNTPNGILDYFLLDDIVVTIRDSYFMGKYIRIRVEPNGTTTGSVSAKLGVKTKSN